MFVSNYGDNGGTNNVHGKLHNVLLSISIGIINQVEEGECNMYVGMSEDFKLGC